ncbi:MAG: hypothetical protein V2A56_13355 [bacterium]
MRGQVTTLLLAVILFTGCGKRNGTKHFTPYPWEKGLKPGQVSLLGASVLSTGGFELNASLNEDGREIWITRAGGGTFDDDMTILSSSWDDNKGWSAPVVAPFSGTYVDADPFLTRDGKRLYFSSKRTEDGRSKGDFDIWYVDRVKDGWGEPVRLPEPINSDEHDVSPWIVDDGTLWFASRREGGEGDYDIWYALKRGDGFSDPINAGPAINSIGTEVDVCLSRNATLMIFASQDQPIHFGSGDLYLMLRGHDGGWIGPYNLGQPVNSDGMECCPALGPNDRILLFTSTRSLGHGFVPPSGEQGAEQVKLPDIPGNGLGDLYIVDLLTLPVIQEIGWSP